MLYHRMLHLLLMLFSKGQQNVYATVVPDAVQQRTTKCLPAEECRRLLSRHGKIKEEKMCRQTFPEVNIRQGFL